ncbi:response regulator [Variibacter gotjawalensis]|nr:response regulator [Variibacter gotjawalensis]NIK49870.1 CheY-like chemotaxis protein [Variibacter gotjawalensis]
MLTEDMLDNLGFEITTVAATLGEGLAAARDADVDVAVLDINLRGDTSYPIAEMLLARGIPFVFTSGYGKTGIDPRYAEAQVLQKPFTEQSLDAAISRSVNARGDGDYLAFKRPDE